MDDSIIILQNAIHAAKLGETDKLDALKRLKTYSEKILNF